MVIRRRFLLVLILLLGGTMLSVSAHVRQRFSFPRSQWVGVRRARRVIGWPAVRKAVAAWIEAPGDQLILAYPVGPGGRLWAAQLADWLVALGVPRNHLLLRPRATFHRNRLWLELEAPP
jgi:hypothetical protein